MRGSATESVLSLVELLGANPGPAVHLAVLGVVVLVGLAVYVVVRWRRRREIGEANRPPDATDASSASRQSETPSETERTRP
jgi:hypothetical protein